MQFHSDISKEYAPYITKPMLAMLNHNYFTHTNEDSSVKSYANKDKTYSTTISLDTFVVIAVGV